MQKIENTEPGYEIIIRIPYVQGYNERITNVSLRMRHSRKISEHSRKSWNLNILCLTKE